MSYPAEYYYTKSHEWVKVDGAYGTVGITHFAQSRLGDLVFVDLPHVGDQLKMGKVFGSVEAVEEVSDLRSPVTGIVTQTNGTLSDTPEIINSDPNSAWIIKLKLSNVGEIASLLTAEQYVNLFKLGSTTAGASESYRHSKAEEPKFRSRPTSPLSSDEARLLLGLRRTFSADELKTAWKRKVSEWHPDKLDGMADELRTLATQRVQSLNEAYALLRE
jgi:glycine cleavage system H protein